MSVYFYLTMSVNIELRVVNISSFNFEFAILVLNERLL
jgi:hypothetical protein